MRLILRDLEARIKVAPAPAKHDATDVTGSLAGTKKQAPDF